jgi:CspA family cold shock protein
VSKEHKDKEKRKSMHYGTVSFWKRLGGYGFIVPDADSDDIYVHHKGLVKGLHRLKEGQRVSYELGEYNGRPVALEVAPVEGPLLASSEVGNERQ